MGYMYHACIHTLMVTMFMFEHVMYVFEHVVRILDHVMLMFEHAMCMFEHVVCVFEHVVRTGAICARHRAAGRLGKLQKLTTT